MPGAHESAPVPLSPEVFIWDSTHGMRNLKDVLVNDCGLDLTGWTLSEPKGISADGSTILGDGSFGSSNYTQAWVAVISPEPCTFVQAAVALLCLIGFARVRTWFSKICRRSVGG